VGRRYSVKFTMLSTFILLLVFLLVLLLLFLLVSLLIQFNSIQKERDISKYHSRNRKCGGVSKKGLSISKSKSTATYDQSPP